MNSTPRDSGHVSNESPEDPEIEKLARLARLGLSPEQKKQFESDLLRILTYVRQLQTVPMSSDVGPFFGADAVLNADRADIVLESLDRVDTLRNAPVEDGQHFLVPPVFE